MKIFRDLSMFARRNQASFAGQALNAPDYFLAGRWWNHFVDSNLPKPLIKLSPSALPSSPPRISRGIRPNRQRLSHFGSESWPMLSTLEI